VSTSYKKDYYRVLGVDDSASQQVIREAYRKLAFQYHPDRNKDDPEASNQMKALNEAYATLSNPIKRAEYDSLMKRYGSAAYEPYQQAHSQEDVLRDSDIEQIFQEFSTLFGFRNADEIFRGSDSPGFQTYEYRQPGFIYRSYVYDPTQTGESGTPLTLPSNELSFSGKIIKFFLEKALRIQIPQRGKDLVDVLRVTPETARLGGKIEYNYRKWGKPRNLLLEIPSSIQSGEIIRLRKMGLPGKAGGPPGDLVLRVSMKVPLFQRIRSFFKTQLN
jgi:DnaJ-class molecular chaperone